MIQTPVANKNSDDKKQEDIIGHRNYFNSFFLSDLKKVELFIQEEKYHNIITKYLSLICEQKQDVRDSNYYQENMIVGNIPPVRWPSKGNHSLALSQMLAVKESLETKDIFSINGPPGTGKTTLLKDIIANLIYSKAVRIAKLKKPVDIFNGKSKNFKVNNYNYLAWELNDDFLDLIAVVASSNNNAVENISDEIPFDIDDDLDIDYFKNEASMIFQNEDNLIWPHGMFSATLGKSENKSKFFGGFWPPDQGDKKKTISFKDTLRNSNVTFSEWEKSRKDFLAKIAEYNELISELELVSEAINKEEELKLTIEKLQVKKQSVENALKDLKNNIKILNNNCSRFVSNIESIKQLIELEIRTSPSLLQKIISLFTGGSVLKDWEDKMSVLKRDLHSDYSNKRNTEESLIEMDTELDNLKYNLNEVKTELDAHTEYYSKLHNIKKKYQEIFLREKLPLPDKNFWQQSEEMIHASSPWIYSGLQNIRSKLFKCSCELIKLTILANSDKFINNINVLKVMNFASLPEEGKEYAKHIWNSFALIIPIISTTFASFANLFKDLGSQEIGCLLIDEAGQTSPHKAVGAMWRAKKVIVVGDPLQIEPVETLPEEIGEKIMQSNGIDNKYNPLSSSIQVFADQSNKIGTYISNDNNVIWVGSPLRVHRRCNDPMFKISNQISYNNLMIHRSNNKKLAIERYFPESLWIDVQNTNATDKYVREEGEIIQQLVNYLIYRGNKLPDLFIISPFKNIADKIKALLANDGIIPAMNITKGEKIKWVNKSVGTVHSFQGKESPIVIIVLGCDKDSLKSASWAASKANILNVALTRAKNMVFVVGNSEIWGKKKYFNLVHDKLSKINVRDFRDKLVL